MVRPLNSHSSSMRLATPLQQDLGMCVGGRGEGGRGEGEGGRGEGGEGIEQWLIQDFWPGRKLDSMYFSV